MLRQVFIVNKDLNMGKGKLAVQVAHGEVFYMDYLSKPHSSGHTEFAEWMKDGVMKKIVLKASYQELKDLITTLNSNTVWFHIVYDLGLTQVPSGSMTCIVVEPMDDAKSLVLFGHLTLLWS